MSVIHATEETFSEIIQEGVVVVDFWAEWCAPCQFLSPIVEELAVEYQNRVKVVKVDIEKARDMVQALGIMSIPTIHLYVNGERKEESIGLASKERLVELMTPYL